jgi:predicted sugar kinase
MLVWSALAIDLGGITKKNVDEWVWRLFYQRKTTEMIYIPEKTTPAEVRRMVERWVGLGTNVLTLSRKQWLKKVTEIMANRNTREVADAVHHAQ